MRDGLLQPEKIRQEAEQASSVASSRCHSVSKLDNALCCRLSGEFAQVLQGPTSRVVREETAVGYLAANVLAPFQAEILRFIRTTSFCCSQHCAATVPSTTVSRVTSLNTERPPLPLPKARSFRNISRSAAARPAEVIQPHQAGCHTLDS